MPGLIKAAAHGFAAVEDPFTAIGEGELPPPTGAILMGLERFRREGALLLEAGRRAGVRVEPGERIEELAYDLGELDLIALSFPKFRDGRPYSSAALLRRRYGFKGEIRAVGDVLREQAFEMIRCGFDAFEPADGSTAEDWNRAARRFRYVYQSAADARPAAFNVRRTAIAV